MKESIGPTIGILPHVVQMFRILNYFLLALLLSYSPMLHIQLNIFIITLTISVAEEYIGLMIGIFFTYGTDVEVQKLMFYLLGC